MPLINSWRFLQTFYFSKLIVHGVSEIEIAGVLTNPIARGGVGKKKILFNPFPSSSDYRPFCTSATFYENGYEQTSTKTEWYHTWPPF